MLESDDRMVMVVDLSCFVPHHSPPTALASETETARRSARMALAARSASRRVRSASTTSRKLTRPALKRFTERSKVLRAAASAWSWAAWRRSRIAGALERVLHLADRFEHRLAVIRAGGLVRGDGGAALGPEVFLAAERASSRWRRSTRRARTESKRSSGNGRIESGGGIDGRTTG